MRRRMHRARMIAAASLLGAVPVVVTVTAPAVAEDRPCPRCSPYASPSIRPGLASGILMPDLVVNGTGRDWVRIKNIGTGGAGASRVWVRTSFKGGEIENFEAPVPALAPGEESVVRVRDLCAGAPEVVHLQTMADASADLHVAESDEHNNNRQDTLWCSAEPWL